MIHGKVVFSRESAMLFCAINSAWNLGSRWLITHSSPDFARSRFRRFGRDPCLATHALGFHFLSTR